MSSSVRPSANRKSHLVAHPPDPTHHTATHLLQAALQQLLGKQVKQAGSVVTRDYLRFDYTYHQALNAEQIKAVEELVNKKIWENITVKIEQMTYKDAVNKGIIAFFGDKYNPDNVRAVIVDHFSKELCGGTHVSATGDIGLFKIVEEVALAAGQRRIVAITGGKALAEYQKDFALVKDLSQNLKVKSEEITESVESLQNKIKEQQKEIKNLKQYQWTSLVPDWLESAQIVKDVSYVFLSLPNAQPDELREIGTLLQQKQPGFYFLIITQDGKSSFFATLHKDLQNNIDMKALKSFLEKECGLRGGGNQISLQGGGAAIDDCEKRLKDFLQK